MRTIILGVLFALVVTCGFGADLDPAYRQHFGPGLVIAKNGDYPPVVGCDPSSFDWKDGASYVTVAFGNPICLRSILPAGKRFGEYIKAVEKQQGANLKYKQSDVFYWRLWSDRDENGKLYAGEWPKSTGQIPDWEPVAWFSTDSDEESAGWDTVGINDDAFNENLRRCFTTAKQGQKYYIALSVGYKYMVGAGETEQKWDPILKRFESVVSSGELGFAYGDPVAAGTIIVKENKTGN